MDVYADHVDVVFDWEVLDSSSDEGDYVLGICMQTKIIG